MPQEEMTARFRTSLMGFQKQDVLSWIDTMTAASKQAQEEHDAHAAELRQSIARLEEEKIGLQNQLAEAREESARLEQRMAESAARQEQAEAEAQSYKIRLFDREQETVRLRAQSKDLNAQIERLTGQLAAWQKRSDELDARARDAQAAEAPAPVVETAAQDDDSYYTQIIDMLNKRR